MNAPLSRGMTYAVGIRDIFLIAFLSKESASIVPISQ